MSKEGPQYCLASPGDSRPVNRSWLGQDEWDLTLSSSVWEFSCDFSVVKFPQDPFRHLETPDASGHGRADFNGSKSRAGGKDIVSGTREWLLIHWDPCPPRFLPKSWISQKTWSSASTLPIPPNKTAGLFYIWASLVAQTVKNLPVM